MIGRKILKKYRKNEGCVIDECKQKVSEDLVSTLRKLEIIHERIKNNHTKAPHHYFSGIIDITKVETPEI